jgi:polysaccharide pyruvyl transferase WcaK-like protein
VIVSHWRGHRAGDRPPRSVGLFAPSGWGNLGCAATMQAAIVNIRERVNGATIYGLTLNPDDTQRRHNIPAYPVGGKSGYPGRTPHSDPLSFLDRGVERLKRVSWRLYRLARIATNATLKLAHTIRAFGRMRRSDFLVICGGAQLNDYWGGAWGQPYTLFKLALAARLRGAHVIVLSTGHSPLKTQLGKVLVRAVLGLASYTSYRHDHTYALMRQMGVRGRHPIFPDLAFSLAAPTSFCARPGPSRHVGVSPMAWCDPRVWPEKDGIRYQAYIGKMTRFVQWLINHDYRVTFFSTDSTDFQTIDDILGGLQPYREAGSQRCVKVSPARSVSEVFDVLRDIDIVVANRFHGVIFSYIAGIPAVPISYENKVDCIVDEFAQGDYRLGIDDFTVDKAIDSFLRVDANRQSIVGHLRDVILGYQERLLDQYDLVFGPRHESSPAN